MLNFELEKNIAFSTQDIYDILVFAQQAANDDFFNSFVFERAVWVYAAIILYPEHKDEYATLAAENILDAYSTLLEQEVFSQMVKDFKDDMEFLTKKAESWYEEAAEHLCSPRALLTAFDNFSGEIMQQAVQKLQEATSSDNVKLIEDFTKNWA